MGDRMPTSAHWVKSRREVANALLGSGVNTNPPVYMIVMTGSFTLKRFPSIAAGHRPSHGTVATYVIDAATNEGLDFYLDKTLPKLSKLGLVHDLLPYLRR
jgi:hypothetical protein